MVVKLKSICKRDGTLVPFDQEKIHEAIFKAAKSVGGEDRFLAQELAGVVTLFIEKNYRDEVPNIEDIQDMVEKVLIETGHAKTAKAYILYREKRAQRRKRLMVRKRVAAGNNSTDLSLLVDPMSSDQLFSWDKGRITEALKKEAGVDEATARKVASDVERKVFASDTERISTSLIRELVDNELFEAGHTGSLQKQALIGIPKYDLDMLINSKSKENSNITANNPEAINLSIAETILKQYALQTLFSDDIADAHREGRIHLHDLGYPTRVYCSSHSLEYLKKYGLHLQNLDTASAPAKHARTLTGHLNTYLASMQAYYAGALGVGYINIFYAPYLVDMSYEQMKQEAQHLIFSGSQSAFSRGGQTLFLDFNIHTGIPSYLKDIKAIGPGGKYTGKTYKEYESVSQMFARAMLEVWHEGDSNGHLFAFPKCDLHVNEESFNDPAQKELLQYACQIASENGTPYFIFDRDEVTLSACCRLRTTIDDNYMIDHPESMRFCGFQNVSINLPQAAFRAGKTNFDGLLEEIETAMDMAVKAHQQKKEFITGMMGAPNKPLWEIGKEAADGRPYVDLDAATYIIGIIGLNECVQYIIGQELHESAEALKLGLKIVSFMNVKARKTAQELGLKFTLEESPAESATRRLAKVDLRKWPQSYEVMKGNIDADEMYYTNSIHLRADAPVDIVQRIEMQAKFHSLIESGAIIHAFVGEERPSPESIFTLVKKTFYNTQSAQLTISPEFTICRDCHRTTPRLATQCDFCNSENVFGMTRVVGYFSRIDNWNKSKIGELKDRHRGSYTLGNLGLEAETADVTDSKETLA